MYNLDIVSNTTLSKMSKLNNGISLNFHHFEQRWLRDLQVTPNILFDKNLQNDKLFNEGYIFKILYVSPQCTNLEKKQNLFIVLFC